MYSVVIIDDNKIAVEAIAKSTDWEKCGCRVAGTAYDGIAGLELIHDAAPDIVIIDIQMPGFNGLDVIKKITEMDPTITVNNVGEVDFIIDYHRPKSPNWAWEWIKTIFVCIICFCGASFAIMTFNNDVSVTDVFSEIYRIIMGKESTGFTILEVSYSVGLALGIVGFFNHFAKFKINTDPTPLEVEMRLYEDNVSKTLIQNDGRKEQDIDVS